MKYIFFLLIACLPVITFGQKTYTVTGMSVNSTMQNIASPYKIYKTSMKVIITDTSYSSIYEGKTTTYPIVKKVSDNYFIINDGLQEMKVTIGKEIKSKKYTGFINLETDKYLTTCYFKN